MYGTTAHAGAARRPHHADGVNDSADRLAMISQLAARVATNPVVTEHAAWPFRRSRANADPTAAVRRGAWTTARVMTVVNGVAYPLGLPSAAKVMGMRSGS
jgi:hypothetical protein